MASVIKSSSLGNKIKIVSVLGAGLMGSGIAQVTAAGGYQVLLHDTNSSALTKGITGIESSLKKLEEKGKIKSHKEILSRITPVDSIQKLGKSDLLIEVIIENLEIKKKVWADLAKICEPKTIFASNTSSFPIAVMAEATKTPERFVGLHFFNPVPIMQLVEVVQHKKINNDVLQTAVEFAKSVGKTPVVCNDTPGFIVNRLLVPYIASAMRMVDRGELPENIDTAMKLGASMPIGPLALADLVGNDTCYYILKGWHDQFPKDQEFFIPKCLQDLIDKKKFGRKSGEGFYNYKKAPKA